ncbi:MAG TPA: CHASE3 domain-containing protein [Ferruginibacter sp.]|nr:CHASE3 domain-containing protein [Ferruginibacter sp.]
MSPAKTSRINITYISFLASAVVIVVLTFLSFQLFNKQKSATDLVTHTFLVKLKIEEVVSILKEAESGQRGYLLTDDTAFLQPYKNAEDKFNRGISELHTLVSDNAEQVENIDEFKRLGDSRFTFLKGGLDLTGNKTKDGLIPILTNGRKTMIDIRNHMQLIADNEDKYLNERVKNKLQADKWTSVYILVFSMISFAVLLFSFFRLRNENIKRTEAEINTEILEKKITERTAEIAAINKQLTDQNYLLENKNEELNSFTFIASHDLKEPLRKIEMFTSRIKQTEAEHFSPKSKEYFAGILNASSRMQNLIEAVLSYAQTNTSTHHFKQTDLNETLRHATETLNESIINCGAVINASNLPKLYAVPEQVEQLFTNLISNALKYSKPDTPPVITIKAEKTYDKPHEGHTNNALWKIIFTDNGIGFDDKYKDKIFEIFQRLHGKTEYEGTGVGLAICKKIVENHNGSISAISIQGKGSSFFIILPENYHSK